MKFQINFKDWDNKAMLIKMKQLTFWIALFMAMGIGSVVSYSIFFLFGVANTWLVRTFAWIFSVLLIDKTYSMVSGTKTKPIVTFKW